MDVSFGNWLAGFIDGEGCFTLKRTGGPGTSWSCRFTLALRVDDLSVLQDIQKVTGLGQIRFAKTNIGQDQAIWSLVSKRDCAGLVELLDEYPLRAKKRRDYLLWREAFRIWRKSRRKSGKGGTYRADWAAMELLGAQLSDGRAFQVPGMEELASDPQLRLVLPTG